MRPIVLAILAIESLWSTQLAVADAMTGKVVSIADGDTLTVLVAREHIKVRLEGIDAPEKGQPFGDQARRELSRLVFGQTVQVEATGQDRYGRTLGRVLLGPIDVNAHLVRQGFAWRYVKYSDDRKLKTAEEAARRERRGLWADPAPVPPWDWRDSQRVPESKPRHDATLSVGGFWLNTSTGVRHNSRCENFGKTKRGRACGPNEGKACGICGG